MDQEFYNKIYGENESCERKVMINSNHRILEYIEKFFRDGYYVISKEQITLKNVILLNIWKLKQRLFWFFYARYGECWICKFLRNKCKLNDLSFIEKGKDNQYFLNEFNNLRMPILNKNGDFINSVSPEKNKMLNDFIEYIKCYDMELKYFKNKKNDINL
jgi:hypothetical protein